MGHTRFCSDSVVMQCTYEVDTSYCMNKLCLCRHTRFWNIKKIILRWAKKWPFWQKMHHCVFYRFMQKSDFWKFCHIRGFARTPTTCRSTTPTTFNVASFAAWNLFCTCCGFISDLTFNFPRNDRDMQSRKAPLSPKIRVEVLPTSASFVSDYLILFLPTYSLAIHHLWHWMAYNVLMCR